MKPKLTPVKALALAAVIGATYQMATACYYEYTATCVTSGDPVDELVFVYQGSTPISEQCVADGNWYYYYAQSTNAVGAAYGGTKDQSCTGIMKFTNPITGSTQTVDNWQVGASDNYDYGPPNATPYLYLGLDYSDPDCGT